MAHTDIASAQLHVYLFGDIHYLCNATDQVHVLLDRVFLDLPPAKREHGRLNYILCKSDGTILRGPSIIGDVLVDGDAVSIKIQQETVIETPPDVDPSASIKKTQLNFGNSHFASDGNDKNTVCDQQSFLRQRKINK
eukprot:Phypoly_transcript_19031.p1 GENE.Phypoly_transcript_19031~~Phypoly_transcript_19031.p1  ORF type:complete len:137 (+),score=11.04 Phypoly_transcript_19031:113-523(+)